MAFEKHAAGREQNSAAAVQGKKKRMMDPAASRPSRAEAVYEEDEYTAAGGDEMSGPEQKSGGNGGRIPIVLLCAALIAAGIFLLYKDISRDYRHGIYRCENGRMLEAPAEPDPGKTDLVSSGVKDLAAKFPDVDQYMMLVPAAACIQPEDLPENAQIRDQKADLAQIRSKMPQSLQWIDLAETLSGHSGENLYYDSDIYLTGWGSRYAARAAMTAMEVKIPEGRDQCYLLSNTLIGRLAADRLPALHLLDRQGERLEIYVPENEAYYYCINGRSGKRSGSLYDSAAAAGTSPYDVFFEGGKALTQIHTTAINGETLLVVGDRTADSIVPLFVSSFEHIILMHPSKCAKTVAGLAREYEVTKILYLYDANDFMTDSALLRALN